MRRRALVRAAEALCFVLAAIPIAVVAIDVARNGQPVPFADDWAALCDVAIRSAEGTIGLDDLVRQYNDSRPFFTKVLTAANARLTGWDLRFEMGFGLLLTIGTLALLTSMYRRLHPGAGLFIVVPFASVLFSLTQRFRYMHTIDSEYAFLLFFVVAALWAVTRSRRGWGPFTVAALACGGAMFSFSNGLLTWLTVPPAAWAVGYRQARYWIAWGVAMASFLFLFFRGYRFQGAMGGWNLDPWLSIRFVLAFLGSPLTPLGLGWDAAVGLVGVAGLCANAIHLERRGTPRREIVPWLSLAGFVLLSAVAISALRGAWFGLGGAVATRYSTLASLFWVPYIAVAARASVLALRHFNDGQGRPVAAIANAVAGVVLACSLVVGEVSSASHRTPVTRAHRECFLAVPRTGDVECLRGAEPYVAWNAATRLRLLTKVRRLAELELAAFAAE
jgi:hypothetical protein